MEKNSEFELWLLPGLGIQMRQTDRWLSKCLEDAEEQIQNSQNGRNFHHMQCFGMPLVVSMLFAIIIDN